MQKGANFCRLVASFLHGLLLNCVGHGGIITHNNQQLAHSLLFINAMLEIQRTAKILNGAVALIKLKLQISDLCNYSTVYMLSK